VKAGLALAPGDEPVPVTLDLYSVVCRAALGHDPARIARALGVDTAAIVACLARAATVQTQLEDAIRRRLIDSADVDVETMAKLAAPEAMRALIDMAESCGDAKTKRVANRDVLEFAGAQPAKRVEVSSGDKLLDLMTAAELMEFANGKWPARFADQLRRITVRNQLLTGTGYIDVTPERLAESDETNGDGAG
jgi:hypothetical protein